MKIKLAVFSIIGLTFITNISYAEDSTSTTTSDTSSATPKAPKDYSGSVQFGLIASTGNTHETNANGKFSSSYKKNNWTTQGYVSALNDHDNENSDTHERYDVFAQTQYNFSKKNYTFINTEYLADSDDGYDYISNNTVGYGRNLFTSAAWAMSLDWQIGPGYRFQPNDDSSIDNEEVTGNTGLQFKWQINEINSLEQDVKVSYAQTDTIITSNTAYTAHVYKSLAIQIGFNVKHDTKVPEDSEATDTITTVNVLYTF